MGLEIHADDLSRSVPAATKLKVAHRLWELARALVEAGVRRRHPGLTDAEVRAEVREIFLGGDT